MVAEGPAGVLGAEEAARLQDGDHFVGEGLEAARQPWRHDVEPVRGAVLEPALDLVRYLHRGSGEHVVPAGAGEAVQYLPDGEAFPPDHVQKQLAAAARPARCLQQVRREGLVQLQPVQVHAQQFAQDAQPVLRLGEFVELLLERPRFRLG
jgi:hypothetical protein